MGNGFVSTPTIILSISSYSSIVIIFNHISIDLLESYLSKPTTLAPKGLFIDFYQISEDHKYISLFLPICHHQSSLLTNIFPKQPPCKETRLVAGINISYPSMNSLSHVSLTSLIHDSIYVPLSLCLILIGTKVLILHLAHILPSIY